MRKHRLYPVVEIVRPPFLTSVKRQAPTPSPSPSSPDVSQRSLTFSPRKKRKEACANNPNVDVILGQDIDTVPRLLSPTASEYGHKLNDQGTDAHSPTASDWVHSTVSNFRPLTKTNSSDNMSDDSNDNSSQASLTLHSQVRGRRSEDDEPSLTTFTYEIATDEIEENEDLAIYGETLPEDLSSNSEHSGDDEDVPIRLLNDFTIYDISDKSAAPLSALQQIDYARFRFGASGIVRPWIDDEGSFSESDIESQNGSEARHTLPSGRWERLTLTEILEFNVHHISERNRRRCLDGKIYIRTKFAWYILGIPSTRYRNLFAHFWRQHRIVHLILSTCLKDRSMNYAHFLEDLDELDELDDEISVAHDILGRPLTEKDLSAPEVRAYTVATILELQKSFGISSVPLIRQILGSSKQPPMTKSRRNQSPLNANEGKQVSKHREVTFTTPVVSRIARGLFGIKMDHTAEASCQDEESLTPLDKCKEHQDNPKQIRWGRDLVPGENVFADVIVDGVSYKINDVVMVEPEGYEDSKSSRKGFDVYGKRWWFCQIRYFFETKNKEGQTMKMFHAQWFTHGSETILQELSHPKALYLLNDCDDNPINCIYKKCNFRIMRPGEEEVIDNFEPAANDFHCALQYDTEQAHFTDIPLEYYNCSDDAKSCYTCDHKARIRQAAQVTRIPDGFSHYDTDYHIHDFVYILPEGDSKLYKIGQITRIRSDSRDLHISVCFLKRYDDYVMKERHEEFAHPNNRELAFDERRLVLTTAIENIDIRRLNGICYVQRLIDSQKIEGWVKHDDHFFLNQVENEGKLEPLRKNLDFCDQCFAIRQEDLREYKRFRQLNSKLIGMELFSGAGGLGFGIDLSGYVETKYAIEFSPSAALTYKKNHPNTHVYCQDSSILLKHAIAKENGKNLGPLLSKDNKTCCPEMPARRDKIDFIFGGPPCQSFSRANYSRRPDDVRSTLPCNMLSFVEHYEPDYFLLENVTGLVDHQLTDKRLSEDGAVIEYGMVKFILRTLIALGYQVRYKLLQAGQYGAPQSRGRIIFWGARRGVQLPDFPLPLYAFQQGASRTTLPDGQKMPPSTRCRIPGEFHHCAPLRPPTALDTIGDLPPFDWINPHLICRAKQHQKKNRTWFGLSIPEVDANNTNGRGHVGYVEGAVYMTGPQNRYQRWLREGMRDENGEELLVRNHYTARFAPNLVEATTTVPIQPQANHRDIPIELRPKHARPNAKQEKYSFYGRIDGNQHFKCAMTQLAPNLKNSWPLHPLQRRIISVRECARAQGFPDHYEFLSTDKKTNVIVRDQIRQIGNAVAIPLALALGKQLGAARLEDWRKKARSGSVPL